MLWCFSITLLNCQNIYFTEQIKVTASITLQKKQEIYRCRSINDDLEEVFEFEVRIIRFIIRSIDSDLRQQT